MNWSPPWPSRSVSHTGHLAGGVVVLADQHQPVHQVRGAGPQGATTAPSLHPTRRAGRPRRCRGRPRCRRPSRRRSGGPPRRGVGVAPTLGDVHLATRPEPGRRLRHPGQAPANAPCSSTIGSPSAAHLVPGRQPVHVHVRHRDLRIRRAAGPTGRGWRGHGQQQSQQQRAPGQPGDRRGPAQVVAPMEQTASTPNSAAPARQRRPPDSPPPAAVPADSSGSRPLTVPTASPGSRPSTGSAARTHPQRHPEQRRPARRPGPRPGPRRADQLQHPDQHAHDRQTRGVAGEPLAQGRAGDDQALTAAKNRRRRSAPPPSAGVIGLVQVGSRRITSCSQPDPRGRRVMGNATPIHDWHWP